MLGYSVQVAPDPTVASYELTYTTTPAGSTTASSPTTVPLATGIVCNPLDSVTLTVVATGTDGAVSVPSAPYTFTAAAGPLVPPPPPPPTPPAQPVILGVTQTS